MHVSVMAIRVLVAAVEDAGVPRDEFLADVGLIPTWLDDASARLPLADFGRVARAALARSGDPALGLHMGQHASMAAFDALGHLVEHSACLREALQRTVRYSRIVADGPQIELSEQRDVATIRFTLLHGGSPDVRLAAEFGTSAMMHMIRRFVGPAAQARQVSFAYDAPADPAHRAEYARVFGGRELFSCAFTAIELERTWLNRTRPGRSPEVRDLLQARLEQLLATLERDAPAACRVKRWLASRNLRARPTMDTVARELGMSARSLRRRLHEERSPYSELLEQALAMQAKRLLSDPRSSVQETAYALGFSTPATFSRAFKRWTGATPSAYRAAR